MNFAFKLIIGLLTVGLSWSEVGLAKGKRLDAATKRKVAPNQNDHANYFSGLDLSLSKAALKKADDLRVSTIASIQKLLKSNVKKDQKFELYLRLGELYGERHDYIRGLEIRDFEEAYDRWSAKKKGRAPKLSHKASKRELAKSANSFRKLVQTYPRHRRTDAALYALAKTLGRLDNPSAVLYFNQLIKNHPRSPIIPDAHLALGEYYFDKHKVRKALDSYKNAMKFKESRAYPYAVYKLGWAYFNISPKNDREYQDNVRKSLAAFKLVIKLSDADRNRKGFNLRKEAVNDLVLVWSETGDVESALSYFRRIGENKAFYDLLERLGNIYDENGENKKAISLYKRLLSGAPLRKSSPVVYAKLLSLLERSNQIESLISYAKKMATEFVAESQFSRKHLNEKELLKEAKEKTRSNIHRYSTLYHKRGGQAKLKKYLDAAARLYVLYLDNFPKDKHSYELRFYLADIYFYFKKYESASGQYVKVSKEKPKIPNMTGGQTARAIHEMTTQSRVATLLL